ncbi:ABC transporter permease [Chloroflexota bacterium]
MLTGIKLLSQSKDFLFSWTSRIVQTRYQQSILGWLWIIIQPVATVAIFSIIFTYFVPIDTGSIPYIVFSYTAVIPWTFFSSSLTDMASSVVDNIGLVTKIFFPREILPVAAMLARLLDFGVAYCLLFILMLFYQVPITLIGVLFLPIILVIQIILIIGVGLLLAAMNVFYRDVKSMLTLILQLWFYASPIIYPVSSVPQRLRPLYFLNPMAGIIESYRDVLLNGSVPGLYLLPSVVISLIFLLLGYFLFKRVEYRFADII